MGDRLQLCYSLAVVVCLCNQLCRLKMSILMTANSKKARAGKKKKKAGSTSHKAARVPYMAAGSNPPYSDDKTCVWFWVLDGNPTTVTYCKTKNVVRCNGFILEAYDGFIEGEDDDLDADDDDDYDAGSVIDFAIFVAESQTSHEGRIIRLHPSATVGQRTHDLYVDGNPVPEHIQRATNNDGDWEDDACPMQGGSRHFECEAGSDGFRFEEEPPPYNAAMYGDGTETSW